MTTTTAAPPKQPKRPRLAKKLDAIDAEQIASAATDDLLLLTDSAQALVARIQAERTTRAKRLAPPTSALSPLV